MGLFVDLEPLSAEQTDMALNLIYKAIHDHNGEDIWLPVDNPFVARLVELFTQRGLDRLEAFRRELKAWSDGARHRPGMDRVARPAGVMERWSRGELDLVKLYLEHLPPGEWTLEDHMMMVDWLTQRYLPADDMRAEAEWLATRATIMGRVQANMDQVTAAQADQVIAALPLTAQAAIDLFPFTRPQRAGLEYAIASTAENVREVSNDVRHRMRQTIAQHVNAVHLGDAPLAGALETKLGDQFAQLNRDWRRIAVTETVEAQNQGYIASLPHGARVKRIEQYKGACKFCRTIDGRVMNVVGAGDIHKNGQTDIWPGKTNVGRSAALHKRLGGLLIEREPHELWWPAAGTQHPHCRGRWVPTIAEQAGDDPKFAEWLRNTLGSK
jgi:hypothetical protein